MDRAIVVSWQASFDKQARLARRQKLAAEADAVIEELTAKSSIPRALQRRPLLTKLLPRTKNRANAQSNKG